MGTTDPEQHSDQLEDEEDDIPLPVLPPDGGWGWMVVLASVFANMIVDGVCFSYGIFYIELMAYYKESSSKTALVGSLIPGMYLGIGPIASALANKYGFRWVTIIGSIVASISFFVSTFSPSMNWLIFIYGIMGGFGFGLMYLPSIVVVNFYFDKRRALATGIAVSGSGIGTMLFAPLGRYLLDNFGWQGSYIIISGIILNGIVVGALFRPLEQNRPRRREKAAEEPPMPPNRIMQRIIEEKRRQRTISTGSLDGSVITSDNKLIKDPRLLKKMYLEILEEDRARKSTLSLTAHLEAPNENGSVDDDFYRKGSFNAGNTPKNKYLDRLRSESVPINRINRVRNSDSESSERNPWQRQDSTIMGSRASLASIKKEVARPMYRKDIFYSGSVTSIPHYYSQSSMNSYVASITSIPNLPPDEDTSCGARMTPLVSVLREMFDFSLLHSVTFVVLCICSVLAMIGFFTPFVYITPNAISLGMSTGKATFLITVLGICNTMGRVVAGWVSDQPWADCLLIHNVALVIAGVSTAMVPWLTTYWSLTIYCSIFGGCIAAFISLRSIVLVELLGIEKLTNSFGLLLLFQGIASLIGSPVAGAIFDATQSYTASFVTSGAFIAVAGVLVLPIRAISRWEKRRDERMEDMMRYQAGENGGDQVPLSQQIGVVDGTDDETKI